MKVLWFAVPLFFASAAMAGPEQQAVSGVIAELERAKASLMKEFAARKAFPKTAEWEYRSSSRDAPEIAYNSKAPTSASLIGTITGTKNADLDVRHFGYFATAKPDGSVVWTCGTARSALRTSPSEETSMYPYLPPECRN